MRDLLGEITIDPTISRGQACIRGTPIPVHQILGVLAHGDSFEDLLAAYRAVSREAIFACLEYASWVAQEEVTPLEQPAGWE
jgi:uncharacterized protein (DUF433 family)